MSDNSQEEKLCQEILGDAKSKAERTIARARVQADKAVKDAEDEALRKRENRLKEAQEDAENKCKAIALEVQRETRRHWLVRRERCLDEMLEEAMRDAEATKGTEHETSMVQLAREALEAIAPGEMRVLFNSADAQLVTSAWLERMADDVFGAGHKSVFKLEASADAHPGIVLMLTNGQRVFDNTYRSRLEKMKDQLRLVAID